MVGFGSSLRLARRPGWEGAYLDYETLKLLLSQIEAVYEEEGHSRMSRESSYVLDPLWDMRALEERKKNGQKNQPKAGTTYKDELFLESDSEAAYLSVGADEDDDDIDGGNSTADHHHHGGDGREGNHHHHADHYSTIHERNHHLPPATTAKPFTLSYSQEQLSESSDEEVTASGCLPTFASYDKTILGGTGGSSGASGTAKKNKPGAKSRRRNKSSSSSSAVKAMQHPSRMMRGTVAVAGAEEEDSFYNVTSNPGANRFYVPGHHANDEDEEDNNVLPTSTPTTSNLPNATSIDYSSTLQQFPTTGGFAPNETSTLLPGTGTTATAATSQASASFFTFSSAGGTTTPPRANFSALSSTQQPFEHSGFSLGVGLAGDTGGSGGENSPNPQMVDNNNAAAIHSIYHQHQPQQNPPQRPHVIQMPRKSDEERKKERRARRARRQKLRAAREKREKKVPPHLRLAHAKARAITERFLGLLRAETEKVLLFAQSRLGELADTVGSLRFPSFDEEYAANAYNPDRHDANRARSSYEFGDGGMHPSASSSSDDGAGGGLGKGSQWADFSDEDEENSTSMKNRGSTMPTTAFRSSRSGSSTSGKIAPSSAALSLDDTNLNFVVKSFDQDETRAATARAKDIENMQIIKRQIAQFTELRKRRGIFQRNDQIVGEDMLFLSATEEADGYTAVGVELIHVLRYICVNLIAVRKICRKHDRLLMNRMLGGYYQRARRKAKDAYSHNIEDSETLGGLIARISGDIYEAHPALIGQMYHYKLVGVYDRKIQKLANSRTVQVVSSCLALSLSEYEVARSRADALTGLNSTASVDNGAISSVPETENDSVTGSLADPPSTASGISLTRLRYTIMSVFALREASRLKIDHFMTYLSRASLVFTGQPVIGEGLDGCSRETLDFLVSYNPDSALLLDSSVLFDGLKQNRWHRLPMADVMIASLAAATTPDNVTPDCGSALITREAKVVRNAVSLVPERKTFFFKGIINGNFPKVNARPSAAVEALPPVTLRLSRISMFLYMMNYFVVNATTLTFLQAVGAPSAHLATIIGIPNISAAVVAILHCWLASRDVSSNPCRLGCHAVRGLMVFSCFAGVVGNALHAMGVDSSDVRLAVVGRVVFGLSGSEILQREIMNACVPAHIVEESARLMLSRIVGVVSGLLVGSLSLAVPIAIQGLSHSRELQGPSWLMMVLWLFHCVGVLINIRPGSDEKKKKLMAAQESNETSNMEEAKGGNADDDSSSSGDVGNPSSVLYRSTSEATPEHPITSAFPSNENIPEPELLTTESTALVQGKSSGAKHGTRKWKTLGRIGKLFSFHAALPMSLLFIFYASFALEVFFTSASLIGARYFGWSGARAGTFIGFLALLIFPTTFICQIVARRYEERTVVLRATSLITIGLFVLINWESMLSLLSRAPMLLSDTDGQKYHPYDWWVGVFQYAIGLTIVVIGLVALEGASLSLLSKVSPVNTRSILINVGTMSTFVGLFARTLGNCQILAVELSHKLINTDIMDVLVIPLLLACILLTIMVKKNFFYLM